MSIRHLLRCTLRRVTRRLVHRPAPHRPADWRILAMLDAARAPLCTRCQASFRAPGDALCTACRFDVREYRAVGVAAGASTERA